MLRKRKMDHTKVTLQSAQSDLAKRPAHPGDVKQRLGGVHSRHRVPARCPLVQCEITMPDTDEGAVGRVRRLWAGPSDTPSSRWDTMVKLCEASKGLPNPQTALARQFGATEFLNQPGMSVTMSPSRITSTELHPTAGPTVDGQPFPGGAAIGGLERLYVNVARGTVEVQIPPTAVVAVTKLLGHCARSEGIVRRLRIMFGSRHRRAIALRQSDEAGVLQSRRASKSCAAVRNCIKGVKSLPFNSLYLHSYSDSYTTTPDLLNVFSQISNFFTGTTPSRSSGLGGMTEPEEELPQNVESHGTPVLSQDEMRARMIYERSRAEKARARRQGREQKWEE
ncbi:hypothetical protein EXIGLDRAFT_692899 [Exidia glandulosa HHB12029]|uniref:Uncharacterized protein n=1 Tax=Exidia glandulosa HHB12029 TaxID=1314781 RepID=A0A165NZD4_EXIGL|nr:hypothetical protein EXIGLDRAFT_692899 [Exidia glandulosa HHB12029]